MFRKYREDGYEVIPIVLSVLLIFLTLFLAQYTVLPEQEVPAADNAEGSYGETIPPESRPADIGTSTTIAKTTPTSITVITILLEPAQATTTTVPDIDPRPQAILDGLQIDACVAADESGSCQNKLLGLGIVEVDDCCKYLGRCCV